MQQTITHCQPYTKAGKEQSKPKGYDWITAITSGISGSIGGAILGSFANLPCTIIGAVLGFYVAGFAHRKKV